MPNMGIGFASQAVFKRQNRFVMHIPGVTHGDASGSRPVEAIMVEERAARPSLSFEEIKVPHLIETISYAGRPIWAPLKVTLFDISFNNPVWSWINNNYNVGVNPATNLVEINYFGSLNAFFKKDVNIFMLDGCGYAIEAWTYMNAYPSEIDFGGLDMAQGDVMRVDITMKYDRAYWEPCDPNIIALAQEYMFP